MTDQIQDKLPPALQYERWPIAALAQDPHNARGHPDRNLDELEASLQRWGQRLPVVVRHGQLVGGNATTEVAGRLGWTHLDVVVADDLSQEEAEKLAIALNRTAELATWNRDILTESLVSFDGDLEGTGFTAAELEDLLELGDPPPPDTSPQLGGLEYRVIVECASESEQARLVAQFSADGLECRAVITEMYRSGRSTPCRSPLVWCLVVLPAWVERRGRLCPTCQAMVGRLMAAIDVVVESPVPGTPRVRQLEGMFDVPRAAVSRLEWHGELDLDDRPWNVGLVVGPSGAGKTTIVRQLFGPPAELSWDAPSVVDAFADGLSMEDISRICQAVGFNTIPAWMRPYRVLSTGEQFRVDLARRMLELPDPVVVDEFSSVVDRQVAQIGAHAVQKYARAQGRRFIASTCHFDVLDWLQPDWVLEPTSMSFTCRSLQRRPELEVTVAHVPYAYWRIFAPFHYLTSKLHKAATCWVLFVGDRPAVFAGVLHRPAPKTKGGRAIKGVSRLVTLPDWQGLGLAFVLADTLGAAYKAMGLRLRTYPAHPALIRSFDRSPKWALISRPGSYMGFGTQAAPDRKASQRAGRATGEAYQRTAGAAGDRLNPIRPQQGGVPGTKREGQARRASSRRGNPKAEPWEPGEVRHQGARPNAIFEWAAAALPLDQAEALFAGTTLGRSRRAG